VWLRLAGRSPVGPLLVRVQAHVMRLTVKSDEVNGLEGVEARSVRSDQTGWPDEAQVSKWKFQRLWLDD